MIFCGDIAIPFRKGVDIIGIPDSLKKKSWVGNLEGTLIDVKCPEGFLKSRVVFNDMGAIRGLCSQINFRTLGIGNNHLTDTAPVSTTIDNIAKLGLSFIGAGEDKEKAKKIYKTEDYVILAFGWEGISCKLAKSAIPGVNAYNKWDVITQANHAIIENPDKKIICFMHWNYELEFYPQPLDRELSHRLIDLGVEAVIGCHAHRVQPIELYKGHPIVYGLGNFAFRQGVYMGGNLRFPECSYDEIAFEITKEGSYIVHHLRYNPENYSVEYVRACEVENASFADMNEREYAKFFKKNRIQKKLLPIFYYNDSRYKYQAKIAFVVVRQIIINLLVQNKAFFRAVKSLASKIS